MPLLQLTAPGPSPPLPEGGARSLAAFAADLSCAVDTPAHTLAAREVIAALTSLAARAYVRGAASDRWPNADSLGRHASEAWVPSGARLSSAPRLGRGGGGFTSGDASHVARPDECQELSSGTSIMP
uniref:Uncharacterized protein n=1 Tax=Cafeteria roenbergensis TaxID=33653 RepID=A0A7S0JUG8_CAFRO